MTGRSSESSFNAAKKVSDFVAFLSRAAFLALLTGLTWASIGTADSTFKLVLRSIPLVFLVGLNLLLLWRVAEFLWLMFDEIELPGRNLQSPWRQIATFIMGMVLWVPLIMGWQGTIMIAQRFGHQQIERFEPSRAAKDLLMPPPPRFE